MQNGRIAGIGKKSVVGTPLIKLNLNFIHVNEMIKALTG